MPSIPPSQNAAQKPRRFATSFMPRILKPKNNFFHYGRAPHDFGLEELQTQRGVSRERNHIVIDWNKTTSYMYDNLQRMEDQHNKHDYTTQNRERLAVIKQLSQLGFSVVVPQWTKSSNKEVEWIQKARKHARVFKARNPKDRNSFFDFGEVHSAYWLRDLWTKFGSTRYKRITRNGRESFGEGGKIVFANEHDIIAHKSLKKYGAVKKLERLGYRFYFVGDGEILSPSLTRAIKFPTYVRFNHPDLLVGGVGKVLLVDPKYFSQEGTVLGALAKNAELTVLQIPEAERAFFPANFLTLGKNHVMVDRSARQTIKLLRDNGVKVTPTALPLRANRENGGGVRCIVNEL